MRQCNIDAVRVEIDRLLARFDELDKKAEADSKYYREPPTVLVIKDRLLGHGCQETGAIKRASLDLARSLVKLRRAR